jgi:hypothetical protein
MISNGQQSDNRDDIVAEPMDGFSSLRLKQSWYKRGNSARGFDTNLAVLRHDTQIGDDTKRHAANAVPGHDKCGQARPSCPGPIPCPAQWTMAKPYLPWHSPRRQALGGWHGRHRPTFSGEAPLCPGPWTDRLSQVALPPRSSFASAIAWYHSSQGIIPDESLSARIKDLAAGEPSDYRRARKKRAQR